MGCGKLQMITLFGIGHAAARKKGPADESRAADLVIEDENWFSYLKIWAIFFGSVTAKLCLPPAPSGGS